MRLVSVAPSFPLAQESVAPSFPLAQESEEGVK